MEVRRVRRVRRVGRVGGGGQCETKEYDIILAGGCSIITFPIWGVTGEAPPDAFSCHLFIQLASGGVKGQLRSGVRLGLV